jgi:hypothetical protein
MMSILTTIITIIHCHHGCGCHHCHTSINASTPYTPDNQDSVFEYQPTKEQEKIERTFRTSIHILMKNVLSKHQHLA